MRDWPTTQLNAAVCAVIPDASVMVTLMPVATPAVARLDALMTPVLLLIDIQAGCPLMLNVQGVCEQVDVTDIDAAVAVGVHGVDGVVMVGAV